MTPLVQRGFAIISALFILVVLAMLAAFVANISGAQHLGSAQDVVGAHATQAARAGLEWALYRQQRDIALSNACPVSPINVVMPATATTLSGFTVTVQCTVNGGAGGVVHIVSTACNQPHASACPNTTDPNEFYVERQVEIFLQ